MLIQLTAADKQRCYQHARKITRHRPNHPTYATDYAREAWENDPLLNNYFAACAELAVAQYYDLPWSNETDTNSRADVGDNIEVRNAKQKHYGLIIKWKDVQREFYNVLCYVYDRTWPQYEIGDVELIGGYPAPWGWDDAGQCTTAQCCSIINIHTRVLGQRHLERYPHES